jgi:hypothetical protein
VRSSRTYFLFRRASSCYSYNWIRCLSRVSMVAGFCHQSM